LGVFDAVVPTMHHDSR